MLVVLVAAFCDLFYTVYQQSVRQVAEYQYVTPIVLSLTMVYTCILYMYVQCSKDNREIL